MSLEKSGESRRLYDLAAGLMPGGVNSPVRAFGSVGGEPPYIARGHGCRITDADGNEYMDFCGSWGPLILGHAHPEVVEAVRSTAADGLSFGACSPLEVEMAELLTRMVPSLEMVRLVNSGTEAAMSAIRLARGFTKRSKIIKFDGCYHGHSDSMLVSAGSGLLTSGVASSAGVTPGAAADTLVVPYNDRAAVEERLDANDGEVAAVIVEPVAGNMGLVEPEPGFLEFLRRATAERGTLLIFDEVITGFRLAPTTYGSVAGIEPDLTILGKIIGGGMPIGAFGGRAEIMRHLAPLGEVYQAGTLSGNPVALAAGTATLRVLERDNPYPRLEEMGKVIADAFEGVSGVTATRLGGMFTIFFSGSGKISNLDDAKRCDTAAFARFHRTMLKSGYYLSPSQFELGFVSAAHSAEDVERFAADAAAAARLALEKGD